MHAALRPLPAILVATLLAAGCRNEDPDLHIYWESFPRTSELAAEAYPELVAGIPAERRAGIVALPDDVPLSRDLRLLSDPLNLRSWQNFTGGAGGFRYGRYALTGPMSVGAARRFYMEGLQAAGWTPTGASFAQTDGGWENRFNKGPDHLRVRLVPPADTTEPGAKLFVSLWLNPPVSADAMPAAPPSPRRAPAPRSGGHSGH